MSKYGAVRTGKYASKKEEKRAAELRLLEKAGRIRNLREQVKYQLIHAQYAPRQGKLLERAVHYVADFTYYDIGLAEPVCEDVKGRKTRDYIIKRKLMLWVHGIRIQET